MERGSGKKTLQILFLAVFIFGMTIILALRVDTMTAFAAESVISESHVGSISIQLTDGKDGSDKSKIKFYCEKIGELKSGEYVLSEQYQKSGVNLNELANSEALQEAAEKLAVYEITDARAEVTDSEGYVVFSELEIGVYLVRAEDTAKYDVIEPTLITIPTWDELEEEMLYDVVMIPKHIPRPDEPEKDMPKTGVRDNIEPYLVCAAASLIITGVLLNSRKKKRSSKCNEEITCKKL